MRMKKGCKESLSAVCQSEKVLSLSTVLTVFCIAFPLFCLSSPGDADDTVHSILCIPEKRGCQGILLVLAMTASPANLITAVVMGKAKAAMDLPGAKKG